MASNRRLNIPITTQWDGKGVREAEKDFDKLEQKSKRTGAELVASIGDSGPRIGTRFRAGIAPIAGIAAAAGIAAGAALSKGVMERLNIEEANAKLKVQLGLTEKESARIGKLAGQLYASNYGDSLGEVNDALKGVIQNIDGMGKASGSRLQGITGDVISLSKAFDQDLGGTTRAVGQMMRTGLAKNAQEALNVIAVGFQHGADKSEDFLDTLNEYGTQFRKLGLDGAQATGLISQGLQAGARDSDIVADAIKEFSIRAIDGSETTKTGFDAIGLSAEKMSARIGKGGDSAAKGLDATLDRLRKIEDPVKREAAAVALFGTQAEDLGQALFALDPSKAVKGLGDVGGAARRMNQELGDTPKGKIQEFWRTLTTGGTSALGGVTKHLGTAAGAATKFIKGMRDGSGAGGEFSSRVRGAIDRVKTAVSGWVDKNRSDINSVVNAFKTVGRFAKDVFQETMLPIIRRTMKAIGPIFDGLWHTIRGVVRLISGLLSGNWSKAWDGAKEAVGGAWKAIKNIVVTQVANLWEIIKDFGPKIVKGIVRGLANMGKALTTGIWEGIKAAARAVPALAASALKGIGRTITDTIKSGFGKLIPGGDGLGKLIGDGMGSVGKMFPAFGGGLMGARPNMAPVAGIASRFGLSVTSGRYGRENSITSSGNRSYHSTGEALDIGGTPAGMLGFFRFMKNTLGGSLAELIHTPGGAGIRNGAPYTYSGQVAADHYDHVHVAIDSGVPGVGDGLGRFSATSYGPPWGGIQGGGVTATGVNLRGSPHIYGVAVDPRVIPLGSKVKAWPNPFGYHGTFTAFDTGGAIKGKDLDFYDWRGRSAQLGWGTRSVLVELVDSGSRSRRRGGSSKSSTPSKLGKSSVPLFGSAGGGPITGYDPEAMYGGLPERTSAQIRAGVDPTSLFIPASERRSSSLFMPRAPGIKGISGPVKGLNPNAPEVTPPDVPAPATEFDYLDAALAEAEATTGLGDDRSALANLLGFRQRAYAAAVASRDPRQIAQARRDLTSAEKTLSDLDGTIKDNTDALKAHTDALTSVQTEMKRQTDVATSIQSTESFQIKRYLADVLSGQIAQGIIRRGATAGTGVEVAF